MEVVRPNIDYWTFFQAEAAGLHCNWLIWVAEKLANMNSQRVQWGCGWSNENELLWSWQWWWWWWWSIYTEISMLYLENFPLSLFHFVAGAAHKVFVAYANCKQRQKNAFAWVFYQFLMAEYFFLMGVDWILTVVFWFVRAASSSWRTG